MRRLAFFLAVVTVSAGNPLVSLAQSGFGSSGGSSGGGFGSSSGGGAGGGGGLSALAGALGGSGGGMGGGGMGGLGGSGAGGIGGNSPFGQAGGTNGQMGGQQQGQFLGRNTNQNQFLGRNTQGATGVPGQGQVNGARRGAAGNRNANQANNMNGQQQGGPANARGGANQLPPIRPRQKVAFEYTRPQLAMVSTNLQTRINKMTAIKSTNLNMSVEPSGELVIKGKVGSAAEAKLAENLARLEPGVYAVRNELTYPEPASDE